MCFIAPDRHDKDRYWVVRDAGSRLHHEVYDANGDGEEGDIKLLEPDAFATQQADASSSSSEDSSDAGSDTDSEVSDNLGEVDETAARAIDNDNNMDFLWQGS